MTHHRVECRVVRSGSGSIRSSYSFSRRTAEMRNALRIFLHQCYVLRRFVVQQSLVVLPIQEVSADISLCRPLPVLCVRGLQLSPRRMATLHAAQSYCMCSVLSDFVLYSVLVVLCHNQQGIFYAAKKLQLIVYMNLYHSSVDYRYNQYFCICDGCALSANFISLSYSKIHTP